MVNNSRSLKRGKHKLEPISIDELAGDSTMTGFSDLFKIPTGVQQSRTTEGWKGRTEILLNRSETAGSEADPSEADGFETGPAKTGPPETDPLASMSRTKPSRDGPSPIQSAEAHWAKTAGIKTGPPETDPPETDPLFWSESPIQIVSAPLPRKFQIREAKLVQEGHTYGEQTVYEALWKHGAIMNEHVRVITIGFLKMATIAGLAESNCKAAVAGLLDKLTIERLPEKNIAQGRTYRVYNWTSILARRRAAGLTHVIKSRGVVFVDPNTGRQLTAPKTLPRRQGRKSGITVGRETTGGETGGSVSSGPRAVDSPIRFPVLSQTHHETQPLSSSNRATGDGPQEHSPLQSEIGDLASRLRNDLDSAFDDSAAGRLWRECQTSVSDCTVDEVMHFVVLKGQKIYRDRNIRNPIGLLLMSIPEFFTGNAVQELRAEKRRDEEQHRESQVQQRKYWKEVADDPNTPSDERELAVKFLAEID